MRAIERVVAPRFDMLEQACKYVMLLGYTPSDCLIQTLDPMGECRIDRLLVRGEPFFEVKSTRVNDFDNYKINFTYEPRIIAWPPLLDAPAPASTPMSGKSP